MNCFGYSMNFKLNTLSVCARFQRKNTMVECALSIVLSKGMLKNNHDIAETIYRLVTTQYCVV